MDQVVFPVCFIIRLVVSSSSSHAFSKDRYCCSRGSFLTFPSCSVSKYLSPIADAIKNQSGRECCVFFVILTHFACLRIRSGLSAGRLNSVLFRKNSHILLSFSRRCSGLHHPCSRINASAISLAIESPCSIVNGARLGEYENVHGYILINSE